MKSVNSIFAVCVCALILTAGCNKTDQTDARTVPSAPPQAQSAPGSQTAPAPQAPPSTPTAPMPPPDAPKNEASAGPKPGQANDHSNPEFKAGGKEVQK